MRKEHIIEIENIEIFKLQLLNYGNKCSRFIFMDSNDFCKKNNLKYSYYDYDFLVGIDSIKEITGSETNGFNSLSAFNKENNDWIFGYLTYDLKNETENLTSENIDELNFVSLHFFIPKIVILSKNNTITALYIEDLFPGNQIQKLISDIKAIVLPELNTSPVSLKLESRFSKYEYLETVKKLKNHIQLGDIYEINFCQEFFSHSEINPLNTYLKLKNISPSPFSCFYKLENNYLLSSSPERFIKKMADKIISQPIKGTIKRSTDELEDLFLKEKLLNDPKERAENVMIVDLVRNDLSRTALKGSVKVEELYGIYSFRQVHQMISTVVSNVDKDIDIIEIIKNAFPMGSMTGAPKIRAMELIEAYEKTKRGLYSGSVGFISPEKDFDFNVVIRSILYNQENNYVSFTVGGAITSLADPENEYEECMLKAEAMLNVLK